MPKYKATETRVWPHPIGEVQKGQEVELEKAIKDPYLEPVGKDAKTEGKDK